MLCVSCCVASVVVCGFVGLFFCCVALFGSFVCDVCVFLWGLFLFVFVFVCVVVV